MLAHESGAPETWSAQRSCARTGNVARAKVARAHKPARARMLRAQKSCARSKVARTRKLRTRGIACAESCAHEHCARGKLRARRSCSRTEAARPEKFHAGKSREQGIARAGKLHTRQISRVGELRTQGSPAYREVARAGKFNATWRGQAWNGAARSGTEQRCAVWRGALYGMYAKPLVP